MFQSVDDTFSEPTTLKIATSRRLVLHHDTDGIHINLLGGEERFHRKIEILLSRVWNARRPMVSKEATTYQHAGDASRQYLPSWDTAYSRGVLNSSQVIDSSAGN
jgi:hypothetical protein